MSSSTTTPEGPRPTPWYIPYVVPPVSASVSVPFIFRGFITKSLQQQGKPTPKIPLIRGFAAGIRSAPTIGGIIGTQLISQDLVEKNIFPPSREGEQPTPVSMISSSAIIGALSVPGLVIFNGQSMGKTPLESITGLSPLQSAAIVSREIAFLISMRISEPVSNCMKDKFGDSPTVVYGSTFASGAFGSLISHPADTALTCWQNGMRVTNLSHAMRGGPVRALTVGSFATLYQLAKETFSNILA